ncbi:MAG: hypothetical protein HY815_17120 [Candidatus Riflebacteria bacterium]|nr:hypothetical protein [Candidatus Riflebacteria bacterium]
MSHRVLGFHLALLVLGVSLAAAGNAPSDGPTPAAAPSPLTTASSAPRLPGAKCWDVPGGRFMLPDWTPLISVVEKATGLVLVSRPSEKGAGVCLTWSFQPAPLTMKDLRDVAPVYIALLRRFSARASDDAAGGPVKTSGDTELNVVFGHPALEQKYAIEGPTEATLVIWDCAPSRRTFALLCHAPHRPLVNRLVYAVTKYAACHSSPVDYEGVGPLAVELPGGWKTVSIAPNLHVLGSADGRLAVHLIALGVSKVDSITRETVLATVEAIGTLTGKIKNREAPVVNPDPKLGHTVGHVRARMVLEEQEVSAVFEAWFCPHRQRVFARVVTAPASPELENARPLFDSVRWVVVRADDHGAAVLVDDHPAIDQGQIGRDRGHVGRVHRAVAVPAGDRPADQASDHGAHEGVAAPVMPRAPGGGIIRGHEGGCEGYQDQCRHEGLSDEHMLLHSSRPDPQLPSSLSFLF